MSNNLQLTIKTPTKIVFSGEAEQVSIPTMSGAITVLPNHANMITLLDVGIIKIYGKEKNHFICFKGTVRIQDSKIIILTEEASTPAEDVLAEIQSALKAAQEGKPKSIIIAADLIRAEKQLRYYLLKQN